MLRQLKRTTSPSLSWLVVVYSIHSRVAALKNGRNRLAEFGAP
jgi:hypothetical protein